MTITIDGIPVGGSTGKVTYGRNRAGAYTRRRTKPVNPNSALQQEIRAAFAAAINSWTDELTAVQRSAWDTYAAGVPWLNSAGQAMFLTGQNMYTRFYQYVVYWSTTAPTSLVPPASFDIGAITPEAGSLTLTYDTSADTLQAGGNFPLATNLWQVEDARISFRISQPSNASRGFRPNRFKKLTRAVVAETPVPAVLTTAVPSPWVFQAGQVAWVEMRALTPDNQLTETKLGGPILVTVVA